MGGLKAWKEMQRKGDEWRNSGFDEVSSKKTTYDDVEGQQDSEHDKRDLYAEYDIDPCEDGPLLGRPRVMPTKTMKM